MGGVGVIPASSSVTDLTEALCELSLDNEQRLRLGERASTRTSEFTIGRVTELYERLIETGSRRDS